MIKYCTHQEEKLKIQELWAQIFLQIDRPPNEHQRPEIQQEKLQLLY